MSHKAIFHAHSTAMRRTWWQFGSTFVIYTCIIIVSSFIFWSCSFRCIFRVGHTRRDFMHVTDRLTHRTENMCQPSTKSRFSKSVPTPSLFNMILIVRSLSDIGCLLRMILEKPASALILSSPMRSPPMSVTSISIESFLPTKVDLVLIRGLGSVTFLVD